MALWPRPCEASVGRDAAEATSQPRLRAIGGKATALARDVASGRVPTEPGIGHAADVLEGEGLLAYEPNPRHRRAKLARVTPAGARVLARIQRAQRAWAARQGAAVGMRDLQLAAELLQRIRGRSWARD